MVGRSDCSGTGRGPRPRAREHRRHRVAYRAGRVRLTEPGARRGRRRVRILERGDRRARPRRAAAVPADGGRDVERAGERRTGQHLAARPRRFADPGPARRAPPDAGGRQGHAGRQRHSRRADRVGRGAHGRSVRHLRFRCRGRRGQLQATADVRRTALRRPVVADDERRRRGIHGRRHGGNEPRRRPPEPACERGLCASGTDRPGPAQLVAVSTHVLRRRDGRRRPGRRVPRQRHGPQRGGCGGRLSVRDGGRGPVRQLRLPARHRSAVRVPGLRRQSRPERVHHRGPAQRRHGRQLSRLAPVARFQRPDRDDQPCLGHRAAVAARASVGIPARGICTGGTLGSVPAGPVGRLHLVEPAWTLRVGRPADADDQPVPPGRPRIPARLPPEPRRAVPLPEAHDVARPAHRPERP